MDRVNIGVVVNSPGKCWSHKKKYLGMYKSVRLTGPPYDLTPEYTFDEGAVTDLELKFTEVPCKALTGGRRRKSRKSRKTRRNRRNRTNRR